MNSASVIVGRPDPDAPRLRSGPACPRCGSASIWATWFEPAPACPECDYDLHRHDWAGAMWLATWSTLCLLVPWIVAGMIATGGAGSLWVSAGAVAIALIAPPAGYRYAKGAMLRLLYRLDPPSDFEERSAQ